MKFLDNASQIKVLIIGDVMLDRYWWGAVTRISPEAPVPVVNLNKVSVTLGGAANVAANVAGLGAVPYLIGIVGEDQEADLLVEKTTLNNVSPDYLIKSSKQQTTIKTRVIAQNQQIVRIDQETKTSLTDREEESIWKLTENLIQLVNIIIISDYDKGLLSDNLLTSLITQGRAAGKIILVDPKGKNFTKYKGADMLTPNRFEIGEVFNTVKYSQESIEQSGSKLLSDLNLTYLLVTQGEDGMTLFEKDKIVNHLSVESRNVYDVTGAGDTVIACLAVAMAAGASFSESAQLANIAAGLVIESVGTTAITLDMMKQALKN